MEVLRFHFGRFDPRFQKVVEDMRLRLVDQCTIQNVSHGGDHTLDRFRTTENLHALRGVLNSPEARRNRSSSSLQTANC